MSVEDIQQIIRRSVMDRAFAKALLRHFNEAICEYNLTPIEKAALKAMQIEFDDRKKSRPRSKHSHSSHKTSKAQDFYKLD